MSKKNQPFTEQQLRDKNFIPDGKGGWMKKQEKKLRKQMRKEAEDFWASGHNPNLNILNDGNIFTTHRTSMGTIDYPDLKSVDVLSTDEKIVVKEIQQKMERIISDSTTIRNDSPLKKGRPSNDELPVKDSFGFIVKPEIPDSEGRKSEYILGIKIILKGLAPGLNGSQGLINEHWQAGRKRRDAYIARIKALNPPKIKGQVKMTFIRYSSRLSDWDNAVASCKKIIDAMKHCKVIEDDSPKIIVEFLPKQVKCRHKDAKMEFIIEKL